MGSCAAPSAKGDDKFITTDYLQQCPIGYIRVSTIDQNIDLQRNALTSANCDRIFEDRISGKIANRPGLKRALKYVNKGDTLVVWKLDRLGRSVKNLVALISELHERGAHFHSLTDSIDTSSAMGRFFFHVMSALAEMERELIVERTLAGLAAARAQGRLGGRPRAINKHEQEQISRLLEKGHPRQQLAIIFGIGVSTLYRYFPASRIKKRMN
ncbi:recombinase family protein [Salmonella enterica subsp. enterica serovar Typhimurium]|nr:recombinase family protein [Salmonella enterica subsp. enterica serovar 1,4,[5],12:i:-]